MGQILRFFSTTFFLLIFTISCGPANSVSTIPGADNLDDLENNTVVLQGTFRGRNGYTAAGNVQLILSADGQTYSLVFENFRSSNGPDLKVYLSSDSSASSFINLGELKSVSGTLRYDFPASQYNASFDNALIWCQRFGVLFGVSELN